MKTLFTFEALTIGLAMFAMFFGAGNLIFPLGIGQIAQDKNFAAMAGLLFSAALMPFAGVFAMILFDGNYREFFYRIGRTPGFLLALVIISLLGPLGSTPRCIALTYSTIKSTFPDLSSTWFSAGACVLLFISTLKPKRIIGILGKVLTPLLLISLGSIVILGLLSSAEIPESQHTSLNMFFHGLSEGYKMMDLLAAFFFSSTILTLVRSKHEATDSKYCYIDLTKKASIIGATLLSLVYIGFSTISAFHAADLDPANNDELLSAIALKIAGPYANLLVCATVTLACFTTAMTLIAVFAEFIQKEVFQEKISYKMTLAGSLLLTFAISTLEFNGISAFLGPILAICYPGLIVLTLLNIAYKLKGVETIKAPVFATFALSALVYFW